MILISILLLVLVIFVCFFLLYTTSKQDFVLLRQNISLAEVFDLSIATFIIAFLFGRVLYIINDFKFELMGFLSFFHLLKFPGLSPLGFFIGAGLSIFLFFRKKKGLGRIYDIFTISFLPLYLFFVMTQSYPAKYAYLPFTFLFIYLLLFVFSIRSHQKYILKDGSISLIFLLLISI